MTPLDPALLTAVQRTLDQIPCCQCGVAHGSYALATLVASWVGPLEEALEPFVSRSRYFDAKIKANGEAWCDSDEYVDDPPSEIYLGQLRQARKALDDLPWRKEEL